MHAPSKYPDVGARSDTIFSWRGTLRHNLLLEGHALSCPPWGSIDLELEMSDFKPHASSMPPDANCFLRALMLSMRNFRRCSATCNPRSRQSAPLQFVEATNGVVTPRIHHGRQLSAPVHFVEAIGGVPIAVLRRPKSCIHPVRSVVKNLRGCPLRERACHRAAGI